MLQTVLQNIVLTVGTVMLAAQSTTPTTPIQVKTDRVHVVTEGESLSQIAQNAYKNKDAWVLILKDNPQISDPNVVEKGTRLKVRLITPTPDEIAKVATSSAVLKENVTKMHDSIAVSAAPTSTVTTQPAATQSADYSGGSLSDEALNYLGSCEAGMDPAKNTGNGYYGAFQFSYGTWKSMDTGYERADLAPIEVQKSAVQRLLSRSSIFHQFPGCAKKMRSLGII